MQTFQDLLATLHELHADIEQAIAGLPQEALDWQPGPGMNSIGVLLAHVTGAERYWFSDVLMGEPSHRDREAEFRAHGLDAPAWQKRLAESEAYAQKALATLTLPDLETLRTFPRDGRKITVAWSLGHILEHTAIHAGHIQITRQLWEQKAGRH